VLPTTRLSISVSPMCSTAPMRLIADGEAIDLVRPLAGQLHVDSGDDPFAPEARDRGTGNRRSVRGSRLGPARVRGRGRSHAFEVGDGFEMSIGGFRFVAQPSCVAA
jgi:hypothetical protein